MNLAHEIAQIDPDQTSPQTLRTLLACWVEQAKKDAQQIKEQRIDIQNQETHIATLKGELKRDAAHIVLLNEASQRDAQKIAALTYELAWHKRLKFAAKSEAFNAQQRDLFDECCAADLEAIEAELEVPALLAKLLIALSVLYERESKTSLTIAANVLRCIEPMHPHILPQQQRD